jgi:hypothetical protein
MTADVYMAGNKIKGLSDVRENNQDAVSYEGADREYLRLDGGTMSGVLDMDTNNIENANHVEGWNLNAGWGYKSGFGVCELVDDNTTGWNFQNANGTTVLTIGSGPSTKLDMNGHKVTSVNGIEMNSAGRINWGAGDPGGQLCYADQVKIGIGLSNVNIKTSMSIDGAINMGSNKITNLAEPTNSTDAATKSYVDSQSGGGGSDSGVMNYKFTSDGKTNGNYSNGDLFFTTENNVAFTTQFDDTHYVCFAYRDRDGKFWHFAKQSGSFSATACNIYVLYDGKTMGAFEYDGSPLGAYTGSTTGNLVVPVAGWTSMTDSSGTTANAGYRLKCEWFA